MAQTTIEHIEGEYSTARDEYIAALSPSPATVRWVDAWLDYKREQAWRVADALEKTPEQSR